jgi:hypothetical protein
MKKFILAILVALAGVGVAVYFLVQYYAKTQVETRIETLFDRADAFRFGYSIDRGMLLNFFDLDNYDPNAVSPWDWTDKWWAENSGGVPMQRSLHTIDIIKGSKTEVEVEFDVQEGDPGNQTEGIPPDMKIYRYRALLVYDKVRTEWMIRSLKSLNE